MLWRCRGLAGKLGDPLKPLLLLGPLSSWISIPRSTLNQAESYQVPMLLAFNSTRRQLSVHLHVKCIGCIPSF